MSPFNSQELDKSRVQKSKIALSEKVKFSVEMGTRDEIMARLRQVPAILDRTDAEIAETCGVTRQVWANYKSEAASDSQIRPLVALELWNAYGIPMEWVYDGQTTRVPDAELRAKLVKANREAEAWLASRRHPRRNPIAHIAVLAVAGALFFAGSGTAGHAWIRADGHRIHFETLQTVKIACKQVPAYADCMVDHGYRRGGAVK